MPERDFVDGVVELWRQERPELDVASCATLDRLLRISQLVLRRAEDVCAAHGISFWGFAVLNALRRAGSPYQLSPTSLYRSGMVTSGAVTKRVAELERAGLVDRVPDEHDGRSLLVRLTRKGRATIDLALPDYLALQRDVLQSLPKADQRQLATLLRTLLLALEGPVFPAHAYGYSADRAAAGGRRR
jgi:DNA-binding MarR family transcriptional regulator